jgi:hypothetical protein
LIRFADAKLSLLSGLWSGIWPWDDLVLGSVKWATGTVVSGMAVEVVTVLLVVVPGPSDMDGIIRLVRMEFAEALRE